MIQKMIVNFDITLVSEVLVSWATQSSGFLAHLPINPVYPEFKDL